MFKSCTSFQCLGELFAGDLPPHQSNKWRPCSLPAFKFLNAMLMWSLHSLISCFPLACSLQFAANGPTTTAPPPTLHPTPSVIHFPIPFPPFSSPTFSLSLCFSLSSLEASRFNSFAFSHNAVERSEWVGWGWQRGHLREQ